MLDSRWTQAGESFHLIPEAVEDLKAVMDLLNPGSGEYFCPGAKAAGLYFSVFCMDDASKQHITIDTLGGYMMYRHVGCAAWMRPAVVTFATPADGGSSCGACRRLQARALKWKDDRAHRSPDTLRRRYAPGNATNWRTMAPKSAAKRGRGLGQRLSHARRRLKRKQLSAYEKSTDRQICRRQHEEFQAIAATLHADPDGMDQLEKAMKDMGLAEASELTAVDPTTHVLYTREDGTEVTCSAWLREIFDRDTGDARTFRREQDKTGKFMYSDITIRVFLAVQARAGGGLLKALNKFKLFNAPSAATLGREIRRYKHGEGLNPK